MNVGERRLGKKKRLGAVGLHDRHILLIGRDENADAPRIGGADELGPDAGRWRDSTSTTAVVSAPFRSSSR